MIHLYFTPANNGIIIYLFHILLIVFSRNVIAVKIHLQRNVMVLVTVI